MSSLKQVLNLVSLDNAWNHLHWLQEHAPVRINGTGDDLRAAEYFAECYSAYGLEAQVDQFPTYRSIPQRGALHLLSPSDQEIPCEACGHIASTTDDGIEADLVDLGYGSTEEYSGRNVRGRVVLTDITSGPARPEKARIASDHGAAGIIFSNMGPREYRNIPMGAIKSVWGNPTRSSFEEIPPIPAVGITRVDGDMLRQRCDMGSVRIRMIARATQDWGPLPQPRARLRGGANTSGDVLVVAGHFDAWDPGTSDNAAGNALLLELARVFSANREHLKRDIIFGMWNGHEIGEIAGSTWFLDTHWDELDEHGIAYFNVDSVGFADSSYFEVAGNTELVRFHQSVEKNILDKPAAHKRLTRANEQPFFPIGIPAMEGSFRFSDEQIAAWDNAASGWWWHSTSDTLDKVDREKFHQTYNLYAGYIWEMCTRHVLPMDYTSVADDLANRIAQVEEMGQDVISMHLPIKNLQEATRRLQIKIDSAGADDETTVQALNHTQKRLGRILMPAFETCGGRYAQDRVAHPGLKFPLPALHDLQTCQDNPQDSDIHNLLATELLRARNRMSDALRRAVETIEMLVL